MGKRVIYHMEERPRVKIVDYTGLDQSRAHQDRREDEGARHLSCASTRSSTRPPSSASQGIVEVLMAEKGYEFAEVTSTRRAAARRAQAGEGRVRRQGRPEGQGPRHQLRRQRRRSATARSKKQMKSTKAQRFLSWITGKRHLPGSTSSRRTPTRSSSTTANQATCRRASASRRSRSLEDTQGQGRRAGSQLNIPVDEGAALPRRRVQVRRQHGHQDRVPAAALQAEARRVVQREARSATA